MRGACVGLHESERVREGGREGGREREGESETYKFQLMGAPSI